jgi:hypothetical protein
MSYTIAQNEQFGSIEISFDGKPSEAIRDALKALRFRWHGVKKVWYGYADEQTVRAALGEDREPEQHDENKAQEAAPQDHIRIYYNGIKIDGGELIRCYYSIDNNKDHAPSISIHAKDYDDLPRDLLPVENNSDSYTDYFEKDHAYITDAHPLYKFFSYAALKAAAQAAKRFLPKYEKELAAPERYRGGRAYAQTQVDACKKAISAFEAATDPGQPTAADLEAVAEMRLAEENAKKAEKLAEEQREREHALILRNEGMKLIEETRRTYPIKGGEPVVLIHWSEHPAFYNFPDDSLKMSLAAAEIILKTLDDRQHEEREKPNGFGWYYKTKFTITVPAPDVDGGEEETYTGRYDLGDGDGGLVEHIRKHGEYCRTRDGTTDVIRFADYIAAFTAAGKIKKALVHFGYINLSAFAVRVGLSEADAGRMLVELYEEDTVPEGGSTAGGAERV